MKASLSAASYPPLQKTQGRGTHSRPWQQIQRPGHPPPHPQGCPQGFKTQQPYRKEREGLAKDAKRTVSGAWSITLLSPDLAF